MLSLLNTYLFPYPSDIDVEEQLTQVAESDDSESSEEKLEQYFIDAVKKETRTKIVVDNSCR